MTQRYSKYKDSGNEWIGEIPEHWGLNRLKQFGYIYAGLNGKKGDDFSKEYLQGSQEFVPFTTICNYTQIKEENFQYVKVKANEFQNEVVKNDLLFLMSSETLEDIAKSSVYLLDKKSLLNSFCKGFRIESNKLNPIYINYLLNCSTYRKYFELCGRGFTRINIKQEYVCNSLITIPPLPEQESIAQFLDEKCARIDEAVRIKEKQIDLLKEYRQIAIHQAVTKGLNDQVKMKDSGIDWIGEIPEHWEVKRLKNFIQNLEGGVSVNASESESAGENEIGVLKTSAVYRYIFDPSENKKVFKNEINRVTCPVRKGAIIISRMNAPELVGASGLVLEDYPNLFLPDRLWQTIYNTDINFDKSWLSKILVSNGFRAYMLTLVNGSSPSMKNISKGDFLNIFIPVPSPSEQTQIAAHIEFLTAKTDEAIRLKEQQIEQLKQYKTSLINDVVTGKVRVA